MKGTLTKTVTLGALLTVTMASSLTGQVARADAAIEVSALWGKAGERWDPRGRLPDFSYAGYHRGEKALPKPRASVSVKTFGAKGDGKTDDTAAFQRAVQASEGKVIAVPPGRYRITDFIVIRRSGTVLQGAGPEQSVLFFPTPLNEVKPNWGATTSGKRTSNYSWSGGFLRVAGAFSSKELARTVVVPVDTCVDTFRHSSDKLHYLRVLVRSMVTPTASEDTSPMLVPRSLVLAIAAILASCTTPEAPQDRSEAALITPGTSRRPNIVMIVADDLGYADVGMFGGEILTPNIDALARGGVRFTNFYTGPSCSPTRSMLLSGTDSHIAGLGNMSEWTAPNQRGVPGYEGVLNRQVVSFASLLQTGGYHTYMVGKWHMGKQPNQIPRARGFERDFSMLDGAGSYHDMTGLSASAPRSTFTEDGEYLSELPSDYYATKTYTDKMISFIDANHGDGKPFFAYVSHQAPHDPYHLPDDWLRRNSGDYDIGWDELRKRRLEQMKALGLATADAKLAERLWYVPFWSDLAPASRALVGRKTELYAALVENLDHHIGRLIDHLKKIGEFDPAHAGRQGREDLQDRRRRANCCSLLDAADGAAPQEARTSRPRRLSGDAQG